MRAYEVVVIVDAALDDEVIRTAVTKATNLITSTGGTVGRVDRWGKRRFAYEVAHKSEGYYAVIEMTAEVATVAELDRTLGLADEVVRHKIIRLPEKVAGRKPRTVSSEAVEATAETTGA